MDANFGIKFQKKEGKNKLASIQLVSMVKRLFISNGEEPAPGLTINLRCIKLTCGRGNNVKFLNVGENVGILDIIDSFGLKDWTALMKAYNDGDFVSIVYIPPIYNTQ